MSKTIGKALAVFCFFTVVCGLVYTLVVTGIGQLAFPFQANGSVYKTDKGQYSALIGQSYSDDAHLWGRQMSYTTVEVDGKTLAYAGPSNSSPASSDYKKSVDDLVKSLKESNPDAEGPVPVDLVTGSGSGLDPDISVDAAMWQVPRIAKASGKSEDEVKAIIEKYENHKFLGVFGEDTVNVLKVNLALDGQLK